MHQSIKPAKNEKSLDLALWKIYFTVEKIKHDAKCFFYVGNVRFYSLRNEYIKIVFDDAGARVLNRAVEFED